jgi:uncharacterized membrane protein YphA (DoxX/SURF4 family)
MEEAMDWLYLIGRTLFAMVFIGSGFGHFSQANQMAQYAGSKGVAAAKPLVLLTGFMILMGGFSILLGLYMEIGTWLLVLFLLPTSFLMHNFWQDMDPMQQQVEGAMFMKNIALSGAALIIYWVVQTHGYGPFVLGQPM